jgi:hypothetical protein
MTANILRLDPRRSPAVWVARVERPAGWLVVAADHGWLHGSYRDALADARWLAKNRGFVLRDRREVAP